MPNKTGELCCGQGIPGLLRVDAELHQFSFVRKNFFNTIIAEDIAVSVIDTIIHRGLLTAFHTDGSFTAFILGQGRHDGEPKLTITVEGFDAIIDKVDFYPMFFQHPSVLQGVHGISCETGYLTG